MEPVRPAAVFIFERPSSYPAAVNADHSIRNIQPCAQIRWVYGDSAGLSRLTAGVLFPGVRKMLLLSLRRTPVHCSPHTLQAGQRCHQRNALLVQSGDLLLYEIRGW